MRLTCLLALCIAFVARPLPVPAQTLRPEIRQKLDTLVAAAYQEAAAGLPCRVKTTGKLKMIRWKDVDRCLNEAVSRVSWDRLGDDIEVLRAQANVASWEEILVFVRASFEVQALPYERVLTVKGDGVHLPLTNSVLKYLPEGSFQGFPVVDKTGTEVGTFGGVFFYERSGGLSSANKFKLALFQYTDRRGEIQTAADRLLLDSYGVPWVPAAPQPGFRLTTEKLPTPIQ